MTLWSLDKPADDDPLQEITSVVSEQKATFESRIERHFDWSSSTVSAGLILRSATTPGAARMLFGARSAVSQPTKDGIGMIVSDESRLIWFNSEQSSYVGGQGAMLVENPALAGATTNDGSRWVADHGVFTTSSSNAEERVAMNVTYLANAATIQVTNSGTDSAASFAIAVTSVGSSSFSLGHEYLGPGANVGGEIHWRSLGTISL
ncbi:hypothetical protein LCGC14_0967060 [marine sediment metagenome]|uniref:Uncharacterized protein n=1 Tax=marine sediment metagenome TaxID=412755 RepID=A0A0F9NYZ8_9ZZZZ